MFSLRFIFMAVFTPIACGIALRKPFQGLVALVAMYYFRPEIWGAPTWFRPQMYLTAAVAAGWLMNMKEFRWDALMSLAAAITLSFFATSFVAMEDSGIAYDGAVVVMKLVIVMLLTLNLVDTPKKMNVFLWTNVVGFVYNLKSIYITGLSGGDVSQVRVDVGVGQGGGSNYIAMICGVAFAISYVRYLNAKGRERTLALAMMGAYLLALVLTGSRAGYLSLAAVGMYYLARSNRKVVGALTLAGAAVVFFLVVPQAHLDRFKGVLGKSQGDPFAVAGDGGRGRDFSAQSRIILWMDGAVPMFLERPITGVGLDNFPLASPRYVKFYASRSFDPYVPGVKKRGFVAHSTWFQTIAEGGLLVSVPFFALFLVSFWKLGSVRRMRSQRPEAALLKTQALQLEGVLIAFVVSSTFGSHIKIDFFWWYLGAIGAVRLMADRIEAADGAARRGARRAAVAASRLLPAGPAASPQGLLPAGPAASPQDPVPA
jgi:O-antigen ligase